MPEEGAVEIFNGQTATFTGGQWVYDATGEPVEGQATAAGGNGAAGGGDIPPKPDFGEGFDAELATQLQPIKDPTNPSVITGYKPVYYWKPVKQTAARAWGERPAWWPAGVAWPPASESAYSSIATRYDPSLQKAEKAEEPPGYATPEDARAALSAFLEPRGGQYSPDVTKYEIVQDQDTKRWYYQEKKQVEAKAGAGPPPTITWKDGYGWYQSEVDGQWIRIDPKSLKSQFEDSIYEDFLKGDEESVAKALRKWDFLNQPTSMELAQFALDAAKSPADYFTIWAIARGEMPVAANGPFGRIAPNAQWLDATLARLFQWTAGSGLTPDDVLKGSNGQAGPQGNAANQSWDKIQADADATGQNLPRTEPPPSPPSYITPPGFETAEQGAGGEGGFVRTPTAAPVPFGGYPPDVAFPSEEGGGMTYTPPAPKLTVPFGTPTSGVPADEEGYQYGQAAAAEAKRTGATPPDMSVTPAEPDIWARYAASGQMPKETPEQALERQAAALYATIPFGADDEASRLARRQAWVKENELRQKFRVPTSVAGTADAGQRTPSGTVPFGGQMANFPTAIRQAYAGQTVAPVQRQYPAMGGPPFASPESLYNMLPSERTARQQAIKMQGIPWEDYDEQERRATRPTGRTYRRSRFGQTVPFGVGRG